MVKPLRHISALAIVLILGFLLYNIVFWSYIRADIVKAKPNYTLNAGQLNTILERDSLILNSEDIIEYMGVIKEINYLNDRTNILLHLDTDSNTFVICDMQSNQKEKLLAYKEKDTLKVKGIYKGVLKDIILLNCVIAQ